MSEVLYRKYRSENFDEVIGQDHITKTLKSAIKSGKVSHAYLFTGPRGTGKTSVARILAYSVNELKKADQANHLDIIEIDGASNRRIEEIRDLRDRVNVLPTSGKYKVYIIDEAHMLTKEAFNALLKTLEEPPAHVIFILATTEAHKLPETIISRTQRFNFKPISESDIAKHLTSMAKKEGIKIVPEAVEMLALHGEGSFRDSISLLDQLRGSGQKITVELVSSSLGLPPVQSIEKLTSLIVSGKSPEILAELRSLKDNGISPQVLAKDLSTKVRSSILGGSNLSWELTLLKDLLEVAPSPMPQERLEIALLEASAQNVEHSDQDDVSGYQMQPASESQATPKPTVSPKPIAKKSTRPAKNKSSTNKFDLSEWPKIIGKVKERQPTLGIALKFANPSFDNEQFILAFNFPIYKKQVHKVENRQLISDVIRERTGATVEINCIVDKNSKTELIKHPKPESFQAISNIFGGGEVLESTVSI